VRLVLNGALGEIDLRLVQRGSCGRSLLYFRVDVTWRRAPRTIVMLDVELIDRRWRKRGRPLELLGRIAAWQWTNRTFYAEGHPSCPGCGALNIRGVDRMNHDVGCNVALVDRQAPS
jgi:hypothetical protein